MDGKSMEDVHRRLSFLHEALAACWADTFKGWYKMLEICPMPGIRFRRNAIHQLMVDNVRRRIVGLQRVKLTETLRGHTFLEVEPEGRLPLILIRFKHLDRQLLTRNYPTPGARAFDNGLPVDLIPSGIRLTVGYIEKKDLTGLECIYMVRAKGKRIFGQYEIPLYGSGRVIDLPAQRELRAPKKTAARVKVKVPSNNAANKKVVRLTPRSKTPNDGK